MRRKEREKEGRVSQTVVDQAQSVAPSLILEEWGDNMLLNWWRKRKDVDRLRRKSRRHVLFTNTDQVSHADLKRGQHFYNTC